MMRRWMAAGMIATLPLVGVLGAGCGDRSLILTVDVLSFLDPADVSQSYGPIPGGLPTTTVDVASEEVSLLPGVEDVTEIASASLQIGASFDNATGSASVHLLIHITPAESTDVFASAPIADVPLSLTPGAVTNVNTEITSTALAQALVHDKVKIGLRISFDTTGSLSPVQGTETITRLLATVITKKQL